MVHDNEDPKSKSSSAKLQADKVTEPVEETKQHEAIAKTVKVEALNEEFTTEYNTSFVADSTSDENEPDEGAPVEEKEPVTIEFPFSEVIRSRVPKAFEVAEKVATDWKHEGDFTDLGIPHPVAGIVASQALQKAKQVEKKLEEKGVISIAKVGIEIAKSQVENLKNKVKK